MRIRRLTLTGFKSFVDPAELSIEPGLTGIVGPNGCGKSNLLEAIRWVMGEASARSLRGAGMEDVIFAGTAQRPARDFAEVTMALDRADAAGVVREGEVMRRIERGAGSAYRLDGRDVRQRDIALLFADAATGAHSPALVSQGRIGAIIAARPAERRAMLEEAAGIAGLHVRRHDAEQKLRATEANLERFDGLLGDMEGRVQALRRQARAADRYRLMSAEIRVAEGRLIYARWREATAAADVARREAAAAAAMVADASTALTVASAGNDAAVAALGDARRQAQAARDAAADIAHRVDTLRAERDAIDRRIAELGTLRTGLERDHAREQALAEDAAAAVARLDAETVRLDATIELATTSRAPLIERVIAADAAARDADLSLAQAIAAQAAEEADLLIARAALEAAQRRLDRSDAELARIARERDAAGDTAPNEAALAAAGRETTAQEAAIAAAGAAIDRVETARAQAIAGRDAAQGALADARAALAAIEAEASALARSLPPASRERRVLDRLIVAPGHEHALAAALGDDLDAPVSATGSPRWAGAVAIAVPGTDPALPAGCEPLSSHVQAPPELARRLAQIGVIDTDDGSLSLAVGQRLVTISGRMRRWDGFVAEDQGAAAAQSLVRRNRLAEIQSQRPAARAAVDAAQAELDTASAGLTEAMRLDRASRWLLAASETRLRGARTAADRAAGAIERLATRRAELDERTGRAGVERDAAATEIAAAAAAIGTLPEGNGTSTLVAARREAAETARVAVHGLRSELATLNHALATDRERHALVVGEAAGWRARVGDTASRIADLAARVRAADAQGAALADTPAGLDLRLAEARATMDALTSTAAAAAAAELAAEARLRITGPRLANVTEAVALAREARATASARLDNQEQRRAELGRIAGERFQCPAAMLPRQAGFAEPDVGPVTAESQRFEALTRDRERIGPVNLVADQELAAIEADRATQIVQRDELAEAVGRLRGSIGNLNREGRVRLLAAFAAVDAHFRRLFACLFAGGEAHLALVDSDDPLEAGLEIMAQPPGKRLSSLTLLSGGEQALTACALIFALFLTNPAPICVLDEVDAPLDDANVDRFCDLLDQMVRETDTRYLVVTHNAVTMARMHRLFGVTMIERGVSRLVSVDLERAETMIAAA